MGVIMDNDTSQVFTARPEITMKMTLTPEQYSSIKEWSEIIPTLYMLDICVVSATKLTEESLEKQPRKANLVTKLRNLDRPNNGFSYLCALMEKVSDSRGKLSFDELKNQILADISALKSFFKEARVIEENDFVIAFLKDLMGDPIEIKREEYLTFLKKLNNHFKLQNPVSPKQRLDKAKEIILEANTLNISVHHIITTITLACLYGNKSTKKLMKFKTDPNKFDAENALADILLIPRFAKLKLEMEQLGRNGVGYQRVNFITDDNALNELLKFFKPKVVKHKDKADGRESELTMTVEFGKLLEEATEDEYNELLLLLDKSHSKLDH